MKENKFLFVQLLLAAIILHFPLGLLATGNALYFMAIYCLWRQWFLSSIFYMNCEMNESPFTPKIIISILLTGKTHLTIASFFPLGKCDAKETST